MTRLIAILFVTNINNIILYFLIIFSFFHDSTKKIKILDKIYE